MIRGVDGSRGGVPYRRSATSATTATRTGTVIGVIGGYQAGGDTDESGLLLRDQLNERSTKAAEQVNSTASDVRSVAEELAQDALLVALQRWPEQGIPDNPAAWLKEKG